MRQGNIAERLGGICHEGEDTETALIIRIGFLL